jgi:hypothetical protein
MTTTPFFPDPPYFHLRDLAERWQKPEATILSFINTRDLPSVAELAVLYDCREMRIYVSEADLQNREPNPEEELEVQDFTVRDGVLYVRADDYFVGNGSPAQAEQRALDLKEADLHDEYKMDPVVLLADVLAFEKQHGIQAAAKPVRGIETLNTPNHPAYAPELAAAVAGWLAVYADMKSAEEVKALQGRKRTQAYAKAWGAAGFSVAEGEQADRLATVINPKVSKRR